MSTPETIYLIPGEYEGENCLVWCDDPAPSSYSDPDDAVRYVRADIHESALKLQGNAAKMGMDAAKKDAIWREDNAKRLLAESNPAALESERAMNAELTAENERLQARVASLECSLWEAEDPTNPNAFILRKQADAVENLAKIIKRLKDGAFDEGEVSAYAHSASLAEQEAMRLRNDAGKAGGGV
jgi:sRNA-binding carbon storage regulator CsrA